MSAQIHRLPLPIEFDMTVDDIVALSLTSRSRYWGVRGFKVRTFRLRVGITLLIAASPVFWLEHQFSPSTWRQHVLSLALLLAGCTLIGYSNLALWKMKVRKFSKSYAELPRRLRIEFTEQGVVITTTNEEHRLAWASFGEIEESKEHFALRLARLQAIVVPKRALADEQSLSELRSFLQRQATKFTEVM